MKLTVYTDGSGTTGGPAGCAYVAVDQEGRVIDEGGLPLRNATNQQAEILAVAWALTELPVAGDIIVRSDSEYVVRGWNERLSYWLEHDWRLRSGGRAKNIAHWQRLITATLRHREQGFEVSFEWLRGHDGHEHNERADLLAGEARARAKEVEAA